MKVSFTPEALLAVREKRAWWEQNRDKAPGLFVEELASVVGKLREGRDAERQQFAARGGHIIWRILMPKTGNHVYYRVDEAACCRRAYESGPTVRIRQHRPFSALACSTG